MNQSRWDVTVSVKDGQGIVFGIESARHAAEFLILHWPDHARGWKHMRAQVACLDVLEGKREPAFARAAFQEAAREAGILVE